VLFEDAVLLQQGGDDLKRPSDSPILRARRAKSAIGYRASAEATGHRGSAISRGRLFAYYENPKTDLTRSASRPDERIASVGLAPSGLNEIWANRLHAWRAYGGRRFRTLNVLDDGNREGLAISRDVNSGHAGDSRARQLVALYGRPERLRLDNGPELTRRRSPSGALSARYRIFSSTNTMTPPATAPGTSSSSGSMSVLVRFPTLLMP